MDTPLQQIRNVLFIHRGNNRGNRQAGRNTGCRQQAHRGKPLGDRRGLWFELARHLVGRKRNAEVHQHPGLSLQSKKHIKIAQDQRSFRDDCDRISILGTHFQTGAG